MSRLWRQRPARAAAQQTAPGVGRSFLLIFLLSFCLTVFVLFMQRQWRQPGQRALLIVHDAEDSVRKPLSIVLVKQSTQKVFVLKLDREQKLPVWGSDAKYTSDAIIGYSQLEELSWNYTKLVLGLEYGIALDGILWVQQDQQDFTFSQSVGQAWRALAQQSPTTLNYWDRLIWLRLLQRAPAYQTTEVLLKDYLLENESEKQLDETRYDRWANQYLQDEQVRKSGLTIAVLNASGRQGEAQRFARFLQLIGYEVRNVDTVDVQEKSQILYAPIGKNTTAEMNWARQRLRDILSPFEVISDETNMTQRRRSDVIIILGQDQKDIWNKPF